MGSAYLETPQFGNRSPQYCPQIKFELTTYYSSEKTITVDWVLRYKQYGYNPGWGNLTVTAGYNDSSSVTVANNTFTPDGNNKTIASGSFVLQRGTDSRSVPVWLSCNMTNCRWNEELGGNYSISNDYFVVNAAEPPAPPTSIRGVRMSATSVKVTLVNDSKNAEGTTIQISSDKQTWSDWYSTTTGGAITEYTGNVQIVSSGMVYFRAKNTGYSMSSAWCEASDGVQVISKPGIPITLSPVDGAVIQVGQDITFSWKHNPVDGTSQTAYKLVVAGAEYAGTTKESVTIANSFTKDTVVSWYVQTKGLADDYSDASQSRTFTVCEPPRTSLIITSLDNGKQKSLPITFEATFESAGSGSFLKQAAKLKDSNGSVVFSKEYTTLAAVITVSDFVPKDGETYTLYSTVTSSVALSTTVSATFVYEPLPMASLEISCTDKAGASVQLSVSSNTGDELAIANRVEVYRETAYGKTLVWQGAIPAQTIIDRYPPINVAYTYSVVAYADSQGTNSITNVEHVCSSRKWHLMYNGGDITKEYDPNGKLEVSRPNRKQVFYDGRALPVSYDSANIAREYEIEFIMLSNEEALEIDRFMQAGGRGLFRSLDGFVGYMDVDASLSPAFTQAGYYGGCSLKMVQIDGDLP